MLRKSGMPAFYAILLFTISLLVLLVGNSAPTPVAKQNVDNDKSSPRMDRDAIANTDITLHIAVSMPDEAYRKLKEQLDGSYKNRSGYSINLENVPADGYYEQLKTNIQSGDSPDIMLLDNAWVNEFAALGYLSHRADEYFTADLQTRYFSSVLTQVKWNGFLWAIPFQMDPYVMLYNKKALSQYKAAHAPVVPEEFLALQTQILTSDKNKQIPTYIDPEDPLAFLALLQASGNASLDGIGSPVAAGITKQKLQDQLVRLYAASAQNRPIYGGFIQYPEQGQAMKLLENGEIAMMIAKLSDARGLSRTEIGTAPLPHKTGTSNSSFTGSSFVVSSGSNFVKEAFECIVAISESAQQSDSMGRGYPVMPAAYVENERQESLKTTTFQALQAALPFIPKESAVTLPPELPNRLERIRLAMSGWYGGKSTLSQFVDDLTK